MKLFTSPTSKTCKQNMILVSCSAISSLAILLAVIFCFNNRYQSGKESATNNPDPKLIEDTCYNTLQIASDLYEAIGQPFNLTLAKEIICQSIHP